MHGQATADAAVKDLNLFATFEDDGKNAMRQNAMRHAIGNDLNLFATF